MTVGVDVADGGGTTDVFACLASMRLTLALVWPLALALMVVAVALLRGVIDDTADDNGKDIGGSGGAVDRCLPEAACRVFICRGMLSPLLPPPLLPPQPPPPLRQCGVPTLLLPPPVCLCSVDKRCCLP